MGAVRGALLWAAIAPLLAADLVFRVPEVLVRHAAAAKPVGTGRVNATRANDSQQWASTQRLLEVRYEEYFVEHEISTADARKAAAELKLEDVPATLVGCGPCSRREVEYCSWRALADHCCCERRFLPEPFPWLPHACYAGPRPCRPLAHDCARYARLRDCCCAARLAAKWKSILSKSSRACAGVALLLPLLLLLRRLLAI